MNQKAFTLIELLVVITIIVLVATIMLPRHRADDRRLALQRSAHRLTQDIRKIQEMAMSAKEVPGYPEFKGIHGIRFLRNDSTYILFADLNNNRNYDTGERVGDPLGLEDNITVSALSPEHLNSLEILFIPPDPNVIMNPPLAPADIAAKITIEARNIQPIIIQVNRVGLVEIY